MKTKVDHYNGLDIYFDSHTTYFTIPGSKMRSKDISKLKAGIDRNYEVITEKFYLVDIFDCTLINAHIKHRIGNLYESETGKSYVRKSLYSEQEVKEIFKDIQDEIDQLETYKIIYYQSYNDWIQMRKELAPKFKKAIQQYAKPF